MILLILLIIIFIIFKVRFTTSFNDTFKNFFTDFSAITNRYSLLYYYYNTLRTLLIYPEGEKKTELENVMKTIDDKYEALNRDFFNAISKDNQSYKEILIYIKKLLESKNKSTTSLREEICDEENDCLNYFNSEYNIFDSGVDFAYRSSITNVKNLFLDYLGLKDKNDINEINSVIINSDDKTFIKIGLSLSHAFYYIQEKIYEYFDSDVTNFEESFSKTMSLFNIITIIISLFIFIFVIVFMFISIWKFTGSIKDSSFRINSSFYFIEKYSLTNYRKVDSALYFI